MHAASLLFLRIGLKDMKEDETYIDKMKLIEEFCKITLYLYK
jgi:hypothetical protein